MELQINHITKEPYNGNNQVELSTSKNKNGFVSSEWLTFLQAKSIGLSIGRGSHGISIFRGFGSFTDNEDGKIKTVSRPIGFARVFNLDQTKKL